VLAQRLAVVGAEAVHPDDAAELARAARFDPGEGVLEDRRRGRLDPERPGPRQVGVGRRLPLQP